MVRTKPVKPPTDDDKVITASFRVPGSLLVKLDDYATEMMRKTPGLNLTRSDALRVLVNKALEDHSKAATK